MQKEAINNDQYIYIYRLGHRCRWNQKLHLEVGGRSGRFSDDLVSGKDGHFYKLVEELPNGAFRAKRLLCNKLCTSDIGLDLPWDLIGIKKYVPAS